MEQIPPEPQTSGELIKRLREAAELTQSQLAKLLDTSPQYVHQLECSERYVTVQSALRLADALNANALDLITACFNDQLKRSNVSYCYRAKVFRLDV